MKTFMIASMPLIEKSFLKSLKSKTAILDLSITFASFSFFSLKRFLTFLIMLSLDCFFIIFRFLGLCLPQ